MRGAHQPARQRAERLRALHHWQVMGMALRFGDANQRVSDSFESSAR
jgi:hypothetical protein